MDLWNDVVAPEYNLQPLTKRGFHYPLGFTKECHLAYTKWKINSKAVRTAKNQDKAPY
jgi:hypothetical protein